MLVAYCIWPWRALSHFCVVRTQSDFEVPSSKNWYPMNPLRSKHQTADVIKPVWIPVMYWKIRECTVSLWNININIRAKTLFDCLGTTHSKRVDYCRDLLCMHSMQVGRFQRRVASQLLLVPDTSKRTGPSPYDLYINARIWVKRIIPSWNAPRERYGIIKTQTNQRQYILTWRELT